MRKKITLDVVQGIGDIFWIYQKISPHVETINLNICIVSQDVVQKRSTEFVHLLPKVKLVTHKHVSSSVYDQIAKTRFRIQDVLESDGVSSYACNRPLEDGIYMNDIDPEFEVAWGIDLKHSEPDLPWEKYGILYVSGSKPDFAWKVDDWGRFIVSLYREKSINIPLLLMGAQYDRDVLMAIEREVRKSGIDTNLRIGMNFQKVIGTLKRSQFFVGYQSGLNVIADNYDVKQIMLYFPFLNKMINTWAKPKNVEDGNFNGFLFSDSQKTILDNIKWKSIEN